MPRRDAAEPPPGRRRAAAGPPPGRRRAAGQLPGAAQGSTSGTWRASAATDILDGHAARAPGPCDADVPAELAGRSGPAGAGPAGQDSTRAATTARQPPPPPQGQDGGSSNHMLLE